MGAIQEIAYFVFLASNTRLGHYQKTSIRALAAASAVKEWARKAASYARTTEIMFDANDKQKIVRDVQGDHTRRNTVAIFQECAGKTPFIGSATCIQIADRLFIFTAAHNFKDIPDGGKFTVFSITSLFPIPLKVIDQNYGEYGKLGTVDTAWLEIDPHSAARENLVGVSLDRVDSYHVMDVKNGDYVIVGFSPDARRLGSNHPKSVPLVVDYAKPWKDADPKEDRLFLYYPEKVVKEQVLVRAPHPRGMSGGGIWLNPPLTKNQVWSPYRHRLAGINSRYEPPSGKMPGRIIGHRMYHWLNLLHGDHPELSEHIEPLLNESS